MGMVNCVECKKPISQQAEVCPLCGYPFVKRQDAIFRIYMGGLAVLAAGWLFWKVGVLQWLARFV